jgi:uncharacterized ferritin-like protein (DUF455 family)
MGTRAPVEPPSNTLERWCWDFLGTADLEEKLCPPAPPDAREGASWENAPPRRWLARPVRPAALRSATRSPGTPGSGAWREASVRARLVHVALHHELQAAELFAWAFLAFPEAPRAFRAGLIGLCREELAHLGLYRAHLRRLAYDAGAFPVRDWFWERVPACRDALGFVAFLGLGLEGGNLEHGPRFAEGFRRAGDEAGARVFERVAREEIAHVAFAAHWFERLSGAPLDYGRWRAALPSPISPAMLRGRPLNRSARAQAGLDPAFLDALEAELPTTVPRIP